jgi:hypothetical protein
MEGANGVSVGSSTISLCSSFLVPFNFFLLVYRRQLDSNKSLLTQCEWLQIISSRVELSR